MKIIYTSKNYDAVKVTGRYIRCVGSKRKGFNFRVFETETCNQRGMYFGQPGKGGTLREYETDGAEIPEEIKQKAIQTKYTTLWDNPNCEIEKGA